MKIIFFGSDDFALRHLEALIDSSHEVLAVVTQPDTHKNRGMKLIVSPIKECARAHAIDVLQPTDLKEVSFIEACHKYEADLFIVIAYGRFLPQVVLDIPKICALNVHGSLLPKYRGAAPINWAIINGEKETGVSIIKLNVRMDAGDILSHVPMLITDEDTSITLRQRMMEEGAVLLLGTLDLLMQDPDHQSSEAQVEGDVTFAPKLSKECGLIDWNKSAVEIFNKIRGLLPWPGAYTMYEGKRLKFLESLVLADDCTSVRPGSIISADKMGLVVATADVGLLIKKVHLENSKPMDAHSFLIGHPIKIGFQFI